MNHSEHQNDELSDIDNMTPGDLFIDEYLNDFALVLSCGMIYTASARFKVVTLLNPTDYRVDCRIETVPIRELNRLSRYVKAR